MDLAETQQAEKLTDSQDQYRVTREVPLPYSLDELDIDMDEDAEAEAKKDAEDMDANSSS